MPLGKQSTKKSPTIEPHAQIVHSLTQSLHIVLFPEDRQEDKGTAVDAFWLLFQQNAAT